jgi:hypothetical protein
MRLLRLSTAPHWNTHAYTYEHSINTRGNELKETSLFVNTRLIFRTARPAMAAKFHHLSRDYTIHIPTSINTPSCRSRTCLQNVCRISRKRSVNRLSHVTDYTAKSFCINENTQRLTRRYLETKRRVEPQCWPMKNCAFLNTNQLRYAHTCNFLIL